jgi:hypothetical protein
MSSHAGSFFQMEIEPRYIFLGLTTKSPLIFLFGGLKFYSRTSDTYRYFNILSGRIFTRQQQVGESYFEPGCTLTVRLTAIWHLSLSIKDASLEISRPLPDASMVRHSEPNSNAFLAATTAASTSVWKKRRLIRSGG